MVGSWWRQNSSSSCSNGDHRRVEGHQHRLGVAGRARADLLVGRVVDVAALVAARRRRPPRGWPGRTPPPPRSSRPRTPPGRAPRGRRPVPIPGAWVLSHLAPSEHGSSLTADRVVTVGYGSIIPAGSSAPAGPVTVRPGRRRRPGPRIARSEQGQVVDPAPGHPVAGRHLVDRPPGPLPGGQPLGAGPPASTSSSDLGVARRGRARQHQHHLAPHGRRPPRPRPRPAVPRQTSSCSLVSSRATATGRSPPHAAARSASVAATRPGASKSTVVRASAATAASRSAPVPARPGQEPLEAEPVGGQSAGHQGGQHGRGPGDHGDGQPGGGHRRHHPGARGRTPPGIPASLTSATVRPPATAADHLVDPVVLVVLVERPQRHARRSRRGSAACGSAGCPRSRRRRPSARASTARGDRSPRLPIGVPTTTRAPPDAR